MKKINIFILTLFFVLSFCILPVEAVNKETGISITVDGKSINNSYGPVWNDGHTRIMIDANFFAAYLNVTVDTAADVTTISKSDHKLTFKSGEEYLVMDGIGGRKLDAPHFVDGGKLYLPLRNVCEALGATIKWDGDTSTISINTNIITLPVAAQSYLENVEVFDQSTIRITGEKTIYIDPRRIMGEPHDADIILITHTHSDHFEIDSIKKVMNDTTVIYVTEDGIDTAKENGLTNVKSALPNNEYTEGGISFKTIPSYNTSPERQNHQKEYNWVGYIVTVNSKTYYVAGDSDYIPDMNNLDVDVAFLPIDGKYNMDEIEAAQAANAISPKVAVPYHYNNFTTEDTALNFISHLDDNIIGAILTFKMY